MRGRWANTSRPPREMIIDAVSDETGTDPTDLPPLDDVIDLDVLKQLFEDRTGSGTITFSYCEYTITVSDTGRVTIRDERLRL